MERGWVMRGLLPWNLGYRDGARRSSEVDVPELVPRSGWARVREKWVSQSLPRLRPAFEQSGCPGARRGIAPPIFCRLRPGALGIPERAKWMSRSPPKGYCAGGRRSRNVGVLKCRGVRPSSSSTLPGRSWSPRLRRQK